MVQLSQTSLPAWAYEPAVQEADPSGRVHTLIVLARASSQEGADAVATRWEAQLAGCDVRRHDCGDAELAAAVVRAALGRAVVGHRLGVIGTAQDCLAVRAVALRAGMADDELYFAALDARERTVWCAHCRATTVTTAALDEVVGCAGCARSLVVYAHVSRLRGHHLGFMADAEDQPWSAAG